ncbi:hypothetical protein PROFUN_02917 [Planoprotostelium fungivorum]|uniref:SET domain-containing protein n=1 Tax=Planoprotostelium fungivorum TaxID=1890364 RepID=A0A2P6NSB9_9EUKA|nr:hypothetical protein PROFUN_02917 [Planoprotostelium fungivorum]
MEELNRLLQSLPTSQREEISRHISSGNLNEVKRLLTSASQPDESTKADLEQQLTATKSRYESEKMKPAEPLYQPHSPSEIVRGHELERKKSEGDEKGDGHLVLTTFCGEQKAYSTCDVSQLKRSESRRHTVGMTAAVLDPQGDAIMLSIYNYPILPASLGRPKLSDIDEVFPLNTIMMIKEPFCRYGMMGQTATVRVDSPTDIILLQCDDDSIRQIQWRETSGKMWHPEKFKYSAEEYKNRGNKSYLGAVRWYSLGITLYGSTLDTLLLFLNRSQVFLKLERYNSALRDIDTVMTLLDYPHVKDESLTSLTKCLYRKACSLYGLRRWREAMETYGELEKLSQEDSRKGVRQCEARLRETTGQYDIMHMYAKTKENPDVRLDVADYVGPVTVENLSHKGEGRGVITTRDVTAGELLLASRAVCVAYPSDNLNISIRSFNFLNNLMDRTTDVLARNFLVYQLVDQPESIPMVTHLYAGPNRPTLPTYDFLGMRNTVGPHIDPERLDLVTTYNAFKLEPIHSKEKREESATGLFDKGSLFNHSCCPNAEWICFGDVQMIRATSDVPAGSEVYIRYVPADDYVSRTSNLEKYLTPLTCNCPLCIEDRRDGQNNLKKRMDLISGEEKLFRVGQIDPSTSLKVIRQTITAVERHGRELKDTYQKHREEKPDLFMTCIRLAFLYGVLFAVTGDIENVKKSLEHMLEALNHVGTKWGEKRGGRKSIITVVPRHHQDNAINNMIQISASYRTLGDADKAEDWWKAAAHTSDIVRGGGIPLFKAQHERVLSELDVMHYVK